MQVGDCVKTWKTAQSVLNVPVTSCSEPHEAEVYYQFGMPPGDYPGDDEVKRQAVDQCTAIGRSLLPENRWDKLEVAYYRPTATSWRPGVDRVDCLAVNAAEPTTGSLLP